jgi:UDP-glucose 4-epimerase
VNLADAMVRNGVNKLVFSSTAAIFGNPRFTPINEEHPQAPINPYGQTKLYFERVLHDYEKAFGLNSVALRYFNASGADPGGLLGERHDPETHLIPLALRATNPSAHGLTIFGNDYDTKDGTCVRDYIHVVDLCEAHLLAIRHLISGGGSRQYNLGNGEGYTVLEVIRTVEKITGRKVNVRYGAKREGDPTSLVADSSNIRNDWGWRPQFDLEDIVLHAWQWELKS